MVSLSKTLLALVLGAGLDPGYSMPRVRAPIPYGRKPSGVAASKRAARKRANCRKHPRARHAQSHNGGR